MKDSIRRALVAAVLVAAGAPTANAAVGTDFSDLWWNPAGNGEGFNVIQQADILFMTFFVYDASNRPVWYVSSDATYAPAASNFQGSLYATQGPPGQSLSVSRVGTVAFTPTSASTATLTYTIDGVGFSRSLVRQTWRVQDISGTYVGAKLGSYSGPDCSTNGYLEEPGTTVVTQAGSNVTMQSRYPTYSCTVTGSYAQSGRLGSFIGTAVCTTGNTSTYIASEIQVSPQGLTWRATSSRTGSNCSWSGRNGGLRAGQ